MKSTTRSDARPERMSPAQRLANYHASLPAEIERCEALKAKALARKFAPPTEAMKRRADKFKDKGKKPPKQKPKPEPIAPGIRLTGVLPVRAITEPRGVQQKS